MSPPIRIVIIGGAFAGTCALVGVRERFAQQLTTGDLQVLMVDREPFAGPGLAWDGSMTSECQLSNLDVERLELSSDFRPTFGDWLIAEHPAQFADDPYLSVSFPPRWYFGEYLRAARSRLNDHPGIEVHDGTPAFGIRPLPNYRFRITLGPDLRTVEADLVLLCTGAPGNAGGTRFAHLARAIGCKRRR